MDILINVVLPLSLAIIMLSLGIGLTLGDFARVAQRPKAFAIGFASQIVLVPLAAYLVVTAFGLPGELAVGFMLLAFCPGGVTSNIITKLARGDVALSVSLTAVVSILSVITVPLLVAWAVASFMKENAPEVSVASLAIAMFLITTLPVAIGVTIRHLSPATADRVEPLLSKLATALFALIVIAAVAANWSFFVENLATLGPALIALNLALMLVGLGLATLAGLAWPARTSISIETGIQNATLGITLAALITGQTEGFSTMALPSAVYGVTMYMVALPFVAWLRRK
jgi:BASS family bile acid:Na+ symporter